MKVTNVPHRVPQDAGAFVASLEGTLERYARALLHVSRGYPLQETCQVLAVSHGPANLGSSSSANAWQHGACSSGAEQGGGESIVARAPQWGAAVAAPASWRLDRDQVQPP